MLLVWVVKEKMCAKMTQRLLTLAEVQTQTNKNSDKAKKKEVFWKVSGPEYFQKIVSI